VAERIYPVILSGGAGTRLWPASNDVVPKPFLALIDETTTFAATLARVSHDALFEAPIIVSNRDHRFLIDESLNAAEVEATLLLEPEPRDTAAAIAAAAVWIAEHASPDAIMLVLAADHLIRNAEGFHATAALAADAARAGAIVVFGIPPTEPATSYGYIRGGDAIKGEEGVHKVAAFVEKPVKETAEKYVAEGYLWNSGNFTMTVATALGELERHVPEVLAAAKAAVADAKVEGGVVELAADAFAKAPRISFDHAVMEKTDRAAVVAAEFDWSDLGTWHSVWDAADKDEAGNAVVGEAVLVGARGNFISTDRPLVGLVGVEDMVVVASDDAVLVAPRHKSDSVKQLVGALGSVNAKVLGGHARHYRPWGYYQSLDVGDLHQVKRIVVKPGARLSLQRHKHRAEHWTVVKGVAEVTVGMEMGKLDIKTVKENESVYIPLHAIHRMANPGKAPMAIIEVQYGDYLGEDDIERLQDDYGRIQ
jgi:mannose-1-phosphate guanylyltransferase / mannose-6-phosphate isomerase